MTGRGSSGWSLANTWATIWLVSICLLQLGGCSHSEPPPVLTGGKPLGYWVEAARAPDAITRKNAVFELGNAGPVDPAVMPALRAALQDREARVRSAAIQALVKSPAEASDSLPALKAMQARDPDPTVQNYAARAVKMLEERQRQIESKQ